MAAEKRIYKLFHMSLMSVIRNCELLIATRKAVRFKYNLEQCVLAWGTTEPIMVGTIEIGTSSLRRGDELTVFENY